MSEPAEASELAAPPLPAGEPADPRSEEWRRLHPLSPLLNGGLVLLVIAGIIIANFRDRFFELFVSDRVYGGDTGAPSDGSIVDLYEHLLAEGLLLLVVGGLVLVVALIVLGSWVAWRFHTFRIGADAVEERRGVLMRKHRRAPLERIQSVNLQRPLLARMLGLTKIEIVTAGQGGKVDLSYLGYEDAKTVRGQILRAAKLKRGGSVGPAQGVPSAAPTAPTGAAAAETTPATAASLSERAADQLTVRAEHFIDEDIDAEAMQTSTLVRVPVGRLIGSIALGWEAGVLLAIGVGVIVAGAVIEPAIVFGILPLIIVMAGVMIGQFNKGFRFTLSRGSDAVRTGAGLTSTMTETIPFGRIHAIEARQPLFWRPFGWWRVRITTAGHSVAQGGQNATQNVVLPVGREEDVLRVIDTLLPGVADDPHEIDALRDGLSGAAAGYIGGGRRSAWVLWLGHRRAGVMIADSDTQDATLRIRRGALTRAFAVMPAVRAQSVQFRRPLVHRMLGLASVYAHTVLGPVVMQMRGLDADEARGLFDTLEATVLRVQGADAEARAQSLETRSVQ